MWIQTIVQLQHPVVDLLWDFRWEGLLSVFLAWMYCRMCMRVLKRE